MEEREDVEATILGPRLQTAEFVVGDFEPAGLGGTALRQDDVGGVPLAAASNAQKEA